MAGITIQLESGVPATDPHVSTHQSGGSDAISLAGLSVAAGDIGSGNLAVARMPTGGAWALSSDLNIDSNTLVIDRANDRVGMGIASPESELDITGRLIISATGTAPSTGANLELYYSGGGIISAYDRAGSVQTDLKLYGLDLIFHTAASERMRILSGGNVGVGVSDPDALLEVAGTLHFGVPGAVYTWPTGDGADGQFLKTEGDGTLVWAASGVEASDHGALDGLADDDHAQYLTVARHDADDHSGLSDTTITVTGLTIGSTSISEANLTTIKTHVGL